VAGSRRLEVAGAAHRVVAAGVPLLRPDVQVFEAMLEGWRQQQLSRNLAFGTVDSRLDLLRRFRNPKATEFGDFGVCYVRFGKGSHGSGPKRRSVLTVMPWSVDVLTEWVSEVWPYCRHENSAALWPSERSERMSETRFNAVFVKLRERIGLPEELGPHCLRHSYITHLIEDGFDPLFVQQQIGHEYGSTLSVYTSVSSDYKTTVLRAALDKVIEQARGEKGQR
jgi:integrase/recombinase XerC